MVAIDDENAAYELDDDNCPNKVRSSRYKVEEYSTLITLIDKIPENLKLLRNKEIAAEKFIFICDSYQEQPHLVDSFLCELFDKLIKHVKDNIDKKENAPVIHESFKYMYYLTKMRGYKTIVRHLPHENCDFEPLLALLASQDKADVYTWQTRYMLLIWLSIVCMVPFDLHKFDLTDESKSNTIMNRMLDICMVNIFLRKKIASFFNFKT